MSSLAKWCHQWNIYISPSIAKEGEETMLRLCRCTLNWSRESWFSLSSKQSQLAAKRYQERKNEHFFRFSSIAMKQFIIHLWSKCQLRIGHVFMYSIEYYRRNSILSREKEKQTKNTLHTNDRLRIHTHTYKDKIRSVWE